MRIKEISFLLMAVSLLLLNSCKPVVPKRYIQPSKLENVLFDYHVADGMAQDVNDAEKGSRQIEYRTAVLKKYGITQADFDSSMVYYMTHADRLHDIYEHLSKRLSEEAVVQGASLSEVNRFGALSANGDTADVWTGEKSIVLIPSAPLNQSSFTFVTDSAFHSGDNILLTFKSEFVYQDGMRDGIAVLVVRFKNDSIAAQTMHLSSSSRYNMQINDQNHLGIKELKGYFLLNKNNFQGRSSSTVQMMFINNIQLVRMHEKKGSKKTVNTKDTIRTDSAIHQRDSGRVKKVNSQIPQMIPINKQSEIATTRRSANKRSN